MVDIFEGQYNSFAKFFDVADRENIKIAPDIDDALFHGDVNQEKSALSALMVDYCHSAAGHSSAAREDGRLVFFIYNVFHKSTHSDAEKLQALRAFYKLS